MQEVEGKERKKKWASSVGENDDEGDESFSTKERMALVFGCIQWKNDYVYGGTLSFEHLNAYSK